MLAATLSPSYGIYSGYEHFESVAGAAGLRGVPGLREVRDQAAVASTAAAAADRGGSTTIRRDNPALQELSNVTFLETDNEALIAYAKQHGAQYRDHRGQHRSPPRRRRESVTVPADLGTGPSFTVHDLLTREHYDWRIGPNYVRLEPGVRQAHVLRVGS